MKGAEEGQAEPIQETRNSKLVILINLIGAFCTLLGLTEIIRLVASYWGTYGLLANFPLEISLYVVGAVWTFAAFVNFVTPHLSFLNAVRRIGSQRS